MSISRDLVDLGTIKYHRYYTTKLHVVLNHNYVDHASRLMVFPVSDC